MNSAAWILVPLFAGLFVLMWRISVKRLSKSIGMSDEVVADTGRLIRESKWGTAMVNGAMLSGAKLAEYENGWLLRAMPLFGGGKLWLPREHVKLGPPYTIGMFRQLARSLECGEHHISLFTRLAEIVA